jgi:hypothetical protein
LITNDTNSFAITQSIIKPFYWYKTQRKVLVAKHNEKDIQRKLVLYKNKMKITEDKKQIKFLSRINCPVKINQQSPITVPKT